MHRQFVGVRLSPGELDKVKRLADSTYDGCIAKAMRRIVRESTVAPTEGYYGYRGTDLGTSVSKGTQETTQ